jgi:hypothetical protein
MANKKFSDFTVLTGRTSTMKLVGFDGVSNIIISANDYDKLLYPMFTIQGYSIANDTDTDHDIAFGAGICPDSTNAILLSGSAMVKRIDTSWSAGTGNGGLFSGSVGVSTVYYMFVIRKDSDESIDYGFDTSSTAANKPVGYTYYRMIGIGITNASSNWHIGEWWREGNKICFNYKTYIVDRAYAQLGTTNRVLVTITAPTNSFAKMNIKGYAAGNWYFDYGKKSNTDVTPAGYDTSKVVAGVISLESTIDVGATKEIFFRSDSTGVNLGVLTTGWGYNL